MTGEQTTDMIHNEADLEDLAPDGDNAWTSDGGDDVDLGDLRVNFSSEEAESQSFEDLPVGKYTVAITAGKVVKVTNAPKPGKMDNRGKPYYNLTYTVQVGIHQGRKIFDNIMLFEGALYSLSNLCKALGYPVNSGSFKVPTIDELIGQKFIVNLKMKGRQTVKNADGTTQTYEARTEVKGYFPLKDGKVGALAKKDELEP